MMPILLHTPSPQSSTLLARGRGQLDLLSVIVNKHRSACSQA